MTDLFRIFVLWGEIAGMRSVLFMYPDAALVGRRVRKLRQDIKAHTHALGVACGRQLRHA